MNPLNDYPRARRVAYYVQFVVAGAVLLIGLGYGAAEAEVPTWYTVLAAVTSGLWAYLGLTAAHNVPSYRDVVEGDAAPPDEDDGYDGKHILGKA